MEGIGIKDILTDWSLWLMIVLLIGIPILLARRIQSLAIVATFGSILAVSIDLLALNAVHPDLPIFTLTNIVTTYVFGYVITLPVGWLALRRLAGSSSGSEEASED